MHIVPIKAYGKHKVVEIALQLGNTVFFVAGWNVLADFFVYSFAEIKVKTIKTYLFN